MANLLIEIGNTAVKAAWSEESVLGKTFRYQGEKVMDFIASLTEKQAPLVIAVVSVRDLTAEEEALLRAACQYLIVLDPAHPDVLSSYGVPDYLSYDRAASLVAAKTLFKGKSCTVFDLGTTLTVDYLDSQGRYLGGNISVGCRKCLLYYAGFDSGEVFIQIVLGKFELINLLFRLCSDIEPEHVFSEGVFPVSH